MPSPRQPSKMTSMAWPSTAGAHTDRIVETAPKRNTRTMPSLWSFRVAKRRPSEGQNAFALRGAEPSPHSPGPTLSCSSAMSSSETTTWFAVRLEAPAACER